MVLCRLSSAEVLQSRNKNRKWPSVNRPHNELLHPIPKPYYSAKCCDNVDLKNLLKNVSPDPGAVQNYTRLKEEIDILIMKNRICHDLLKD